MGLKQTTTIKQAAQILQKTNSIALFAHTNPDGDTIGSCLGLKLALEQLGKKVTVFCDSPMSSRLSAFKHSEIISQQFVGQYDLYVAVDCSELTRIGDFSVEYSAARETLTIDHHGGEYFSRYNCLYDYASCCQIVYEIVKELKTAIGQDIATYLYMGLCTDTGNFSNSNTNADCFNMAAELYKFGADIERINRVFFRDTTYAETKLLAKALSRIRSYYDDRMFLTYITMSDLTELGLDSTATSGIVSYTIDINTAKVGVCICEDTPNHYKVSMRGKDFSVRDVCKEFGGGGHILASGCRIDGFLEDVIDKIVRVVGFTI